ncbi:unannotated protein [freshwater metagenome]|uniref:Unannotated protein n=1 Tax=freshwater metagenome TaxID=449393 RepID=A0A6J6UBQ5_9ZZZZ|nr:hypothetical protein [Actinomycetota bacterium]
MSNTVDAVRSKAVKGPGLKVPGVIVLQFLLIFLFELFEYSFTKVGFFTGLAILVSFLGGLYLGRPGTSFTNAVNPPIALLVSTIFIMATVGGIGFSPSKVGLELITILSAVAPWLITGAVIAWAAHFALLRKYSRS